MLKRCICCQELIDDVTVGMICKKCLQSKSGISNFKCNPPKSCFICPYFDCINTNNIRTREETKYFKCGFKLK